MVQVECERTFKKHRLKRDVLLQKFLKNFETKKFYLLKILISFATCGFT